MGHRVAVGWNAVTRRGVQTQWGQGWRRHRKGETPPFFPLGSGVLPLQDPGTVLMSRDVKSEGGLGIWQRGNREARSPEFDKFGKRIIK